MLRAFFLLVVALQWTIARVCPDCSISSLGKNLN